MEGSSQEELNAGWWFQQSIFEVLLPSYIHT